VWQGRLAPVRGRVAVTVAVTGARPVRVEESSDHVPSHGANRACCPREGRPVRPAGASNQDGPVDACRQDRGVRDDQRRAIEEENVELFLECLEQVIEGFAVQELGWIWWT